MKRRDGGLGDRVREKGGQRSRSLNVGGGKGDSCCSGIHESASDFYLLE